MDPVWVISRDINSYSFVVKSLDRLMVIIANNAESSGTDRLFINIAFSFTENSGTPISAGISFATEKSIKDPNSSL